MSASLMAFPWWPALLSLAALLLWLAQWRRGPRDPWQRVLGLLAVLGWCALVWTPRWPQPVAPVALITPGDAESERLAREWVASHGAIALNLPTQPTRAEWRQLDEHAGADWQLFGHGLAPIFWQQLASRPVYWQAAAAPSWRLHYPHEIVLGEPVQFELDAPATASEVALLDSRGEPVQITALTAKAPDASVRASWLWRPLSAGRYDWQLQVRDAGGNSLRNIPIAVVVQPRPSGHVVGQFAAPSFEQRALRQWFEQAGYSGEFRSATGPLLVRRDRFGEAGASGRSGDTEAATTPSLMLVSVRAWQQAGKRERQQWLADTAAGRMLVLLADGGENDPAVRAQLARDFLIDWQGLSTGEQVLSLSMLELQRAAWQPASDAVWQRGAAAEVSVRRWQQGRVLWIGLLDSHRWWARQPLGYADWWRSALAAGSDPAPRWQASAPGVVGEYSTLCLDNADPATAGLELLAPDGDVQRLPLQADAWPGRACSAFIPTQAGWYQMTVPVTASRASVTASWRVWPEPAMAEDPFWRAREASAKHTIAPVPLTARMAEQALPRWPFFLLWLSALLLLWWRERRHLVA